MIEPTVHIHQAPVQPVPVHHMDDVPAAVLEEMYWMMSLALDGLLDEADQARFDDYCVHYPAVAGLWDEWQKLDRQLEKLPHVEPAPGFSDRFVLRLAEHEAQQQQRVLALSLLAAFFVTLFAAAAIIGTGAYILSAQGSWLGEQLHNLVYASVTVNRWLDSFAGSLAALATTPQAQALGMMYVVVAIIMVFGWVQLLRRSARLSGAVALPGME